MEQAWLKTHLMTGVKTNTVTAVEVWDRHTHDARLFKYLIADTARNFNMREISADKGYLSVKNLEVVTKVGATPYIPFKSNTILR